MKQISDRASGKRFSIIRVYSTATCFMSSYHSGSPAIDKRWIIEENGVIRHAIQPSLRPLLRCEIQGMGLVA
jgi:hypothetical protein